VFDNNNQQVAEVKGIGRADFRFLAKAVARSGAVTKKWAGLGKELFTSADNYDLTLRVGSVDPEAGALLLAAGLAIDIVFKEGV
jgi:hypothetical protein